MIITIECPHCGLIDDYDDEEVMICEECGDILFAYTEEELQTGDSQ